VINLRTAKTLGLTIHPRSLPARPSSSSKHRCLPLATLTSVPSCHTYMA
jgi:hypothetical protein